MSYLELNYSTKPVSFITSDTQSSLLKIGKNEQSLINKLMYSGLFETENFLNEKIKFIHTLQKTNQFNSTACYESNNKVILIKYIPFNSINQIHTDAIYKGMENMRDIVGEMKDVNMLIITESMGNIIHIWTLDFANNEQQNIKIKDHFVYKFN